MNTNETPHPVGSSAWFGAAEAWERLCVNLTGELLEAKGCIGSFNGQKDYMYFRCGEGCCDERWETKDAFLKSHDDTQFRVITPSVKLCRPADSEAGAQKGQANEQSA